MVIKLSRKGEYERKNTLQSNNDEHHSCFTRVWRIWILAINNIMITTNIPISGDVASIVNHVVFKRLISYVNSDDVFFLAQLHFPVTLYCEFLPTPTTLLVHKRNAIVELTLESRVLFYRECPYRYSYFRFANAYSCLFLWRTGNNSLWLSY